VKDRSEVGCPSLPGCIQRDGRAHHEP
jgi:hypothetical protein